MPAEAFRVAFYDEGGDAFRACLYVGFGVDNVNVGVGAVGDPHFVAVQHVVVTGIFGAQFHGNNVGAGVGLGHGECADVFAADEFGQVFLLLLFGSVPVNLVYAQVGVSAIRQANRGRCAADFFHGNHVREVTHARTAVGFVYGNAQQAHVAELFPQIHGEFVAAVDFFSAWGNFGGCKSVDLLAQHIESFAKAEVEF